MKTPPDTDNLPLDSFAYCVAFWKGGLDAEDEIDHCLREASRKRPRVGTKAKPARGRATPA